jgi:hypothetical protein
VPMEPEMLTSIYTISSKAVRIKTKRNVEEYAEEKVPRKKRKVTKNA